MKSRVKDQNQNDTAIIEKSKEQEETEKEENSMTAEANQNNSEKKGDERIKMNGLEEIRDKYNEE